MNKSVNVFLKFELYTFHALIEWLYLNKPVTGKKKKKSESGERFQFWAGRRLRIVVGVNVVGSGQRW